MVRKYRTDMLRLMAAGLMLGVSQVSAQHGAASYGQPMMVSPSQPMMVTGQPEIVGYPTSLPVSMPAGCETGACGTGGLGTTCDTGACNGSLFDDCSNPCNYPHFYFRSEMLYWWRGGEDGLSYQSGVTNGFPYLQSTSDLDFDARLGGRVTIGRRVDDNLTLEASFFGLRRFRVTNDFVDTPNVFIQRGVDDLIDDVDAQFLTYRSRTYSVEANLKSYIWFQPSISLHAGLRYISHDEDLNIDEFGTVGDNLVAGNYFARTRNHLFGPQIGAEMVRQVNNVEFGFLGRVGLLTNPNSSRLTRIVTDTATGPFARSETDDGTDWSLMLEFGAWANFRMNERLGIRGGYHFLYLDGVALAPEQTFPNAGDNYITNDNSNLFLHGPFIGIEYRLGYCCY